MKRISQLYMLAKSISFAQPILTFLTISLQKPHLLYFCKCKNAQLLVLSTHLIYVIV